MNNKEKDKLKGSKTNVEIGLGKINVEPSKKFITQNEKKMKLKCIKEE